MDKRNQIICSATQLFGSYGYHAVGIDWIIGESQVTKATMYRHFPSKTDLIVEVLLRRQNDCADSLEQALSNAETPLQALEIVFEWHQEWFNTQTFTGCMFAHAAAEFPSKESTINAIAVGQKVGLTARIEKILTQMLTAEKANALAPIIVMLLDGATLSVQVAGRKAAASEAWSAARDLLKGYIAGASSSASENFGKSAISDSK